MLDVEEAVGSKVLHLLQPFDSYQTWVKIVECRL